MLHRVGFAFRFAFGFSVLPLGLCLPLGLRSPLALLCLLVLPLSFGLRVSVWGLRLPLAMVFSFRSPFDCRFCGRVCVCLWICVFGIAFAFGFALAFGFLGVPCPGATRHAPRAQLNKTSITLVLHEARVASVI